MNYKQIGIFIQERRKIKKLTQKELALKIGVTDKAISKWERGLGCPDVSILEVLSKELDCSILELLKGREIKNEVISVVDADDYIKESMLLTKDNTLDKIKVIFNRIIEFIIIGVVLLLFIFNISQIISIDKEYTYVVNKEFHKKFISYTNVIEKNIQIINQNQGDFNKDDYQTIVECINNYYSDIKKIKLFDYIMNKETINYTINDLIFFNVGGYYIEYEHKTLNILNNYNSNNIINSYKDLLSKEGQYSGYLSVYVRAIPYHTYKYGFNNSYDDFENYYTYSVDDLKYLENKLVYDMTRLIHLTELVMEVGDINE